MSIQSIPKKVPFEWQKECLEKWICNHGRGIVNVVTGAGKTFFAFNAIKALQNSLALLKGTPLKVKIIVPKKFLVHQWAADIKSELGASLDEIGFYYGGCKTKSSKKYMIYVINSARYAISRHIMEDFEKGDSVMLIADECHHYGSEENFRIFDFFQHLSEFKGDFFSLGLSATPQVSGGGHSLEPFLGKEIYKYGLKQALSANIICDFLISRIGVDFSQDELADYEEISSGISVNMFKLKKMCPQLIKCDYKNFFAQIQNLVSSKNPNIASLAQGISFLFYKRTEIVYRANARIPCVIELISRLRDTSKIIIFGERIEPANMLYSRLNEIYKGQVGRYHSEMSEQAKKIALDRYKRGEIRILVSCKALDEGLNVPQTDVGIVLSQTGNSRQRIQRLGRILRKTDDNHTALLFMIDVNQVAQSEESDKEGIDMFDINELIYDSTQNDFSSIEFDKLAEKVLNTLEKDNTSDILLSEVRKNIRALIVRGDFMLTQEECMDKLVTAKTIQERNYYVTALLFIRA